MAAPFRTAPPRSAGRPLLERSRLIEMLDGRFERRLTVLRAGAGFGKTILLMQAIQQNAEDPIGLDRWLSCSSADNRPHIFGEGLCQAMGLARGKEDPVSAVCDAIWRENPQDVALVIDDVHTLAGAGEGAHVLERLVKELPNNGHLVLATREDLPFGWARLVASGEACSLDETDLAFDAEEQTAFLRLRGVDSTSRDWASWPALLELGVAAGDRQIDAYLWEEVLAALPEETQRDLARLRTLDWIDESRVAAFARDKTALQVAAALPLSSTGENGEIRLHDLWKAALGETDPHWSDPEFQSALDHLIDSRHFREAATFCIENGHTRTELQAVLQAMVHRHWQRYTPAELEELLHVLPESAAASAEGRALQGYHRLHVDPSRAHPFLDSARVEFARREEHDLEVTLLSALGHLAWFATDPDQLAVYSARSAQLEGARALATRHLLDASRHLIRGEPREAIDSIDAARHAAAGGLDGIDSIQAGNAYLDAGEPEQAISEVDAGLPFASPQMARTLLGCRFDAEWLLGRVDATQLRALSGRLEGSKAHSQNRVLILSVMAFYNASSGMLDAARRLLERARREVGASLGARVGMALAMATVAVETESGNDEAARDAIDSCLERYPQKLNFRMALRGAPLAALVSETARERFEQLKPGSAYQLGMSATKALVRYRDTGDPSEAVALPWGSLPLIRANLVPRVVLELCLAAASGGTREAASAGEELARGNRDLLHRYASREQLPAAGIAKDWLRRIPARPTAAIVVHVLGPLRLSRSGHAVSDPILRRERVRALLARLVSRRAWRRGELACELWPELDEGAAANNLRVNLNHLVKLLEPDRIAGEAPFTLVQDGDTVRLCKDDVLEIDAEIFSAELKAAAQADRAGEPGRSLEYLERALGLYRGLYLEEESESARIDAERIRLQSEMSRAALRAAALRMGRSDFEAAHEWTRRVLEADELSEPAYRIQALIFLRQEDRSGARATLAHALSRLERAGIPPDAETVRLARRIGSGASE